MACLTADVTAAHSINGGSPMPFDEQTSLLCFTSSRLSRVTLISFGMSRTVGSLYVPKLSVSSLPSFVNIVSLLVVDVIKLFLEEI